MRALFAGICLLSTCASLLAGTKLQPAPLTLSQPVADRLDQRVLTLSSAFEEKLLSPNATYPYRVATQMLTYQSPGHLRHALAGGTFAVRDSFTLLAEAIYRGPETHYFGLTFRPSLEWWPSSEKYYLFFSPGGGFGVIDSRGLPGGQGQDLTLNIVVDGGVGLFLNDRTALKIGVQYHHFSNGGMTNPNPGLNVIGPEIGLSVFF